MFFSTVTHRPKNQEPSSETNNEPTLVVSFEGIRQQIRELAYGKWEEAGCPEGRDEEFWVSAERELFGEEPFSDGGYRIKMEDGKYMVIRPT
jgi:hypothetical protein